MVKQSQLFVLDEPTEGLDKTGKDTVIALIKNGCLKNKTIIIATNDQEIVNISDVLIDMSNKPKPNISIIKK